MALIQFKLSDEYAKGSFLLKLWALVRWLLQLGVRAERRQALELCFRFNAHT